VVCFTKIFVTSSHFLPKNFQKRERRKKVKCKLVCEHGCILYFNFISEISADLHPSTEQQAESNIPDLVQTISQSMEHMMVDIDEDPEEFFFQNASHLALQPTESTPKFVLGTSSSFSTSQIKINPSKQRQKKTCAACRDAGCKQRDSCKGSGNRKWCTCVMTGVHGESKR
jgi:hypothetical protein